MKRRQMLETSLSVVGRLTAGVVLALAAFCAVPVSATAGDIADDFKMYYGQQIAGGAYKGPLGFLRDAAAANASAEQVLKVSPARAVIVDRRNGYLQITDGADTDQILTMAIYRKADGSTLLVVGSSDCADACDFSVELFLASDGRLQPIARDTVLPAIAPAQFIRPGLAMPKRLASVAPKVNYVPARVGTTLTLTPWYGYEIEETMDRATRAAIRKIVLTWDGARGRFVNTGGGS
jgi:hypothetical protein